MTRTIAFRASAFFLFVGLVFAALDASAATALAQAMIATALVLGSVLGLFGLTAPTPAPIPVRVRRYGR